MKRSLAFLALSLAFLCPLRGEEIFTGKTPVTAGAISMTDDRFVFLDLSTDLLQNITPHILLTDAAGTYFLSPAAIAAAYQPLDADLTAWAGVTSTANGRALVSAADYAAMRGLLDLEAGTDFLSVSAIAAAYQPLDADLTLWAGYTPTANGGALVSAANYAAMKALLGLTVGTDVQAYDADLTTYAGITPAANTQSLLGAANYAAMRALLDLEAGTDFLSVAAITAAYQPLDSDLTAIAGLADPGADRILFWDDSLGAYTHLTLGTGLSITGTTINSSGGSGDVATDAIWNAAGDLAYGTGSDTATRLGIGTAGQILQVNAGATAPEWTSAPTFASMTISGAMTAGSFEFEGATADTSETTLAVVDPTADRTITLPDATGTVALAQIVTKSTAASYTIGTTDSRELYGGVIYVTGAATITIPAVAAGASFTVITIGAVAVSVDPNASDLIYLDGTALADGDKVTNTSTAGDIAVFTYLDGTGWYCASNGWTDGN